MGNLSMTRRQRPGRGDLRAALPLPDPAKVLGWDGPRPLMQSLLLAAGNTQRGDPLSLGAPLKPGQELMQQVVVVGEPVVFFTPLPTCLLSLDAFYRRAPYTHTHTESESSFVVVETKTREPPAAAW